MTDLLDRVTSDIVRLCSIECKLQMSGEASVGQMFDAWCYALRMTKPLVTDDVIALGQIVEPTKNAFGYRTCGVRVGTSVKPRYEEVPRLMERLLSFDPVPDEVGEWFRQYEEIHPFVDGNGRTGVVLYNWFKGTLLAPEWAPNWWDDDRRYPGHGAGSVHNESDAP